MNYTFKEAVAPNIDELKQHAATKTNADIRLKAVDELGKWKCQQSVDILWHLMINDLVYEVQHEAFLRLQAFGENVRLPKKKKGNLIKQINKKLEKILKPIEGQISFEQFIKLFEKQLPEAYDVCKHDKKGNFDKWLKNIIGNFSSEIKSKISNLQ
ncbi:MAG: hypothetical protein BGO29_14600 [Bacteroidales bacterium 36-12]|nr:MAG: hypothetical protein BGO29_14600 [Bacteroidales bacterium 36-12]